MKNKLIWFGLFLIGSLMFSQEPIRDSEKTSSEYIRFFSNIGFFAGKMVVYNGYLPFLDDLHDTDLAILTKEN